MKKENRIIVNSTLELNEELTEQLREDFTALLEESFQTELLPGKIIVGEILKVDKDGLLVDIGGKSEGFVTLREINNCNSQDELEEQFKAGQVKEFFLLDHCSEESYYPLSIRKIEMVHNWQKLAELKESGETIDVTVTGSTKGGVLVNAMNLKGFIPASQLRIAKTLNDLAGESIPAKILEVDKNKNKLILSNRAAVFEAKSSMRKETIKNIKEGDVVDGAVVKITNFGAFVDINGIDGLLPLSEISWKRINHPSEVLSLGQQVSVQVLTVDKELERISLSHKRLQPDPWETVSESFEVGEEIVGPVSKILSSGVLIELKPGVEAYCAFGSGNKFFYKDKSYQFKIVSIAVADRRITLECIGDA